MLEILFAIITALILIGIPIYDVIQADKLKAMEEKDDSTTRHDK